MTVISFLKGLFFGPEPVFHDWTVQKNVRKTQTRRKQQQKEQLPTLMSTFYSSITSSPTFRGRKAATWLIWLHPATITHLTILQPHCFNALPSPTQNNTDMKIHGNRI